MKNLCGVEFPQWFEAELLERYGDQYNMNHVMALVLEDYFKRNAPEAKAGSKRVLTFGKYKGATLEVVPVQYLRWCLENMTFKDESLRRDMSVELERRSSESVGGGSSYERYGDFGGGFGSSEDIPF